MRTDRIGGAWLALGAASGLACARPVPARPEALAPEALAPGTFDLTLRGRASRPGYPGDKVTLDERITGTACLRGSYVLLDSPDRSRRLLFAFPRLPPEPTQFALRPRAPFGSPRGPADPAVAYGSLNHSPLSRRGGFASLVAVAGTADVAAAGPGDVRGVLRARLTQVSIEGQAAADTADLAGVFRADARAGCGEAPARSEQSG